MTRLTAVLLSCAFVIPLLAGCQKGHYTEDYQYVGDPDRVESAGDGATNGATEKRRMR